MVFIRVEKYSKKAIVIRCSDSDVSDQLKDIGGLWNVKLDNGPGWVFRSSDKKRVMKRIKKNKFSYQEN